MSLSVIESQSDDIFPSYLSIYQYGYIFPRFQSFQLMGFRACEVEPPAVFGVGSLYIDIEE